MHSQCIQHKIVREVQVTRFLPTLLCVVDLYVTQKKAPFPFKGWKRIPIGVAYGKLTKEP